MLQWLTHFGDKWCQSTDLCSRTESRKDAVLVQSQPSLITASGSEPHIEQSSDPEVAVKFRIRQKLLDFLEAYHQGVQLKKVRKVGDIAFRTIFIDAETNLCIAGGRSTKRFRFSEIDAVQLGFDPKDYLPVLPPEAKDESLLVHVRFASGRCLRLVFPSVGQRTDFFFCLEALKLQYQMARDLAPPMVCAAVGNICELPEPAGVLLAHSQSPMYLESMAHHE
eukprot:gnl/MRDRNA2_/MRDRNA2_72387_c0_seq4.p1 gnl/MRDRNA2_/MRDRNA2_72387_c0~~gnl/MRDRNA2_/MRDRNA2_72387_c0_seq4.p1  ORF type:complete len:223 (+),score=33.99 gnl/MRDRNA2_/MRDRNA2_72387_c0_seq4:55-723(+)